MTRSPTEFPDLGLLGSWSWAQGTGRVTASTELGRFLGISMSADDSLPMETFASRVHPDDVDWLRREIPRSYGVSGDSLLEFRVFDRNDRMHWVMCRGRYQTDVRGTMGSAQGFLLDVTDFKDEGNSARIAPTILPHPLRSLVDSVLNAYEAAKQIGEPGLTKLLQVILETSGRLLVQQLDVEAATRTDGGRRESFE